MQEKNVWFLCMRRQCSHSIVMVAAFAKRSLLMITNFFFYKGNAGKFAIALQKSIFKSFSKINLKDMKRLSTPTQKLLPHFKNTYKNKIKKPSPAMFQLTGKTFAIYMNNIHCHHVFFCTREQLPNVLHVSLNILLLNKCPSKHFLCHLNNIHVHCAKEYVVP